MFIQCPQCRTHNDISEDLLSTQEAVMSCRHCHLEFTLTLTPANTPEQDTGQEAPEHPIDEVQETGQRPPLNINISQEELSQLAAYSTEQNAITAPSQNRHITGWSLGIALLLLILISQFSYFNRNDLSRHAALRPWLELICNFSGCTVPLMRDRSRIKFIARHVADHPDARDALIVTLTMINAADFPQPYPNLKLGFSDIDNNAIAQRIFEPSQYLSGQIKQDQGMKPDVPVTVSLALVDPGQSAVNFEFELK